MSRDQFGRNSFAAAQGVRGRPAHAWHMVVGTAREQRRAAERAAKKARKKISAPEKA